MLHWWLLLPFSVSFCQVCVSLIFPIPANHSCLILTNIKIDIQNCTFIFQLWLMMSYNMGKLLPTNHGSTFLNLNMVLLLHYSGNIIHPFYSSRLDLFSYKIPDLYFNTSCSYIKISYSISYSITRSKTDGKLLTKTRLYEALPMWG